MTIPVKVCTNCKTAKPATSECFNPDERRLCGFQSWCRECQNTAKRLKRDIKRRAQKAQEYYDALEFGCAFKLCPICKVKKPATSEFFYANKASRYGLQSLCKLCDATGNKRWRDLNPERIEAYVIAYREENRAELNRKSSQRYYDNREKRLLYCRAYREANPEKVAACLKAWALANPDKVREDKRNAKAKRKQAEGTHTAADVREQFDAQKGRCYWCEIKLVESGPNRFHVDHVYPLSRGGTNYAENICCACKTCNLSKHAKMPWEFAGRLF